MSKWHNKPVDAEGYHFDSTSEYGRFLQLKLLKQAGLIRALKVHPTYTVIPAFKDARSGKKIQKTVYEADFSYIDTELKHKVVEDVKGKATDVFKIKWKLMLRKYPKLDLRLIEV